MNLFFTRAGLLSLSIALALLVPATRADDDEKGPPQVMKLAGGKFEVQVPAKWKKVKPKVRIIEFEFSVPAAKGDDSSGRITVMGAGGSIEANIDRWIAQFTQPDGGSTKDRAKIEEESIAGQMVHLVDISGSYKGFGPQPRKPKYRMLSAIIQTKKSGNYFIKLTGPQRTVAENEKAFRTMIGSLK